MKSSVTKTGNYSSSIFRVFLLHTIIHSKCVTLQKRNFSSVVKFHYFANERFAEFKFCMQSGFYISFGDSLNKRSFKLIIREFMSQVANLIFMCILIYFLVMGEGELVLL